MASDATPVHLGHYGVWLPAGHVTPEVAAGVESLGYGTLWIGGSPAADLTVAESALAATSRLTVATGIVNIWASEARTTADSFHRLNDAYRDRFLLGIGAGHRELNGPQAVRPYQGMVDYLDVLDARSVPANRRVLAALGPRMLALAAERAAGAHPYLVPPIFSSEARATLGRDPLLAPEHTVALGASITATRATARELVSGYLQMRNYRASFSRLGFTPEDFENGGSDRLVDAVVAQGDPALAAEAVRGHRASGADHVAVQLLAPPGELLPGLRLLAPHLGLPERPGQY
ncbi:TIGR03620 family F420-dependent LLM class oxidoreductase [Spiractinospora alimapuensis]|uniref:TIGR03620 family F420-dependent LLM class oxidoreductase n=1 Tax=Spiractinospora alimapuensis TaxID=2820884 RepID=UPI001F27733E|nr:TIGR03620 family F420-dependent LLM class oxidoreductase [Spiractinospora alimapuensis]QVQ54423.1 TIGR03620 family F420-dependent LLM class oxidoreductase [Spiractinospora alimapuensis]